MKVITVNGKEIEIHGPKELSVGGQNRHYFFCDYYGQRRSYGSCIHLLNAEKQPLDMGSDELTCWKAMRSDRCKAQTMRQLEEAVDGSVFYSPRVGTLDRPFADQTVLGDVVSQDYKKSESYMRGWNQVGNALNKPNKPAQEPKQPKPTIVPKKAEQAVVVEQGTLADAINNAVKELHNGA